MRNKSFDESENDRWHALNGAKSEYQARKKMCVTCGAPSGCGGTARECTNCWEVEHRLDQYLRSEKGRAFVREALANEAVRGES